MIYNTGPLNPKIKLDKGALLLIIIFKSANDLKSKHEKNKRRHQPY